MATKPCILRGGDDDDEDKDAGGGGTGGRGTGGRGTGGRVGGGTRLAVTECTIGGGGIFGGGSGVRYPLLPIVLFTLPGNFMTGNGRSGFFCSSL